VGIGRSLVNVPRTVGEENMKAFSREGDNEGTGATERSEVSSKAGDNERTGATETSEVSINGWSYNDGVSTINSLGWVIAKQLTTNPKWKATRRTWACSI
jgi:hypothetical protein